MAPRTRGYVPHRHRLPFIHRASWDRRDIGSFEEGHGGEGLPRLAVPALDDVVAVPGVPDGVDDRPRDAFTVVTLPADHSARGVWQDFSLFR